MKWFISNKLLLELSNGLKNKSNSNKNISPLNNYNQVKLILSSKTNNSLNSLEKSNIELYKVLSTNITVYHSVILPLLKLLLFCIKIQTN